jgi:assimilatory nitrate reductase catalytic subunit
MLDRLGTDGGVRTLLVLASNIAVSAPDANRIRHRLESLDTLIVSDIFRSETAMLADIVLPTAEWAEEEGTMTNVEGRVIRRKMALPPPPGVLDDLQMLRALATGLGRGQYFSDDPAEVFEELRRASAGGVADYAGITYERIEHEQGVFWPCPSTEHPGTPRLFTESFPTADGKARFFPVSHRAPAERPDANYPYVLTTGRLLQQYQSGTQTRRLGGTMVPDPHVQLHPNLARELNIAASDMVELRTRRGAAVFRAQITDAIRPDVLFVPFHWGGASNANSLTVPALDPASKMPEFKVCAVAARRIGGPDDGDLLVAVPAQPDVLPFGARASPHRTRTDRRSTRTRTPTEKETRMHTKNRFLQGIFQFTGAGVDKPAPIDVTLTYLVPDGSVAQALYFRGGNTTDELVTVVLMRDGVPMRYFPIGARSDVHVPLRVVEDLEGGTALELAIAAPDKLSGTVVLDLGLVEV